MTLRRLTTAMIALIALTPLAFAQPLQQTDLYRYADGSVVSDSYALLLRSDVGVGVELHTTGLEAGQPYTAWWVVFNRPDACNGSCDADDIFNTEGKMDPNLRAGVSVLFADGTLADDAGNASFSAMLASGRAFGQVLTGPGLVDALDAEIHMVVRHHGEPSLENAYGQLNRASSCPDCLKADVQFTIFPSQQTDALADR